MKWAKYALVAVAPIILAVGLWMSMRGNTTQLPDSQMFVDVATGEIISKKRGTFPAIPDVNSRDKKPTLYPIAKDESGEWVITEPFREHLGTLPESDRSKIDMTTFRIIK